MEKSGKILLFKISNLIHLSFSFLVNSDDNDSITVVVGNDYQIMRSNSTAFICH